MIAGLKALLTVQNIALMFLVSAIGLSIGALPGLSAGIAVALMIPFTFSMKPVTGLAVLAAVYMSAVYGGCFSAILINTPGTPGSIATCYDGHPMAKQGKGIKAIIAATMGSTFGGLVGCLALLFIAPSLARITLKFGPPEYFWVAIFGLTIMASLGEGNILKTLLSGIIGLLISCIGMTTMGGALRFGFGTYKMQGGINITVAMIGLFCVPEVMAMLGSGGSLYEITDNSAIGSIRSYFKETCREIWQEKSVVLLSSAIGVITGILPGAGATIANLIAYNESKKVSPHGKEFGTGVVGGILAPETANNATVGAGMIPTLTLGVPGTPVAAIIYGAMMMHGLQPGLQLFEKSGDIVYSMIFAFIVGTIIMMIIGITIGTELYKAVVRVPQKYLVTAVMLLAITGAYSVRNSTMDIMIMALMGLLGYLCRKVNLSSGAVVLGLVLGSICENAFVRSVLISKKTSVFQVFFMRPISLVLILISVFSFGFPIYKSMKAKKAEKEAENHE